MDNRTQAMYQALADFSALRREARAAGRELAKLKAAENAYNASSRRSATQAARTSDTRQKAVSKETDGLKMLVTHLDRYMGAQAAAAVVARDYARAQRDVASGTRAVNTAMGQGNSRSRQGTVRFTEDAKKAGTAAKDAAEDIEKISPAMTTAGRALEAGRRYLQGFRRDAEGTRPVLRRLEGDVGRVHKQFVRFGNWRPRLTPPFVALIPIIAAVVAAINPLVALLGAVGMASFGLVANIASLSGAFLALPGILSAVVAGISSVIASMGGVGNVFKTYAAMKKATGGSGGGGESAADRADRLADAEANLGKTQRAVQKAQENLNKAREEALKDLIDLRKEVSRSSVTEERAAADLQQAIDAYNNVMADPSSQKGDKMDAAVRVKEAEQELADVRARNVEAQKELNAAEAKGIEQSDRVLDAQENLNDAVRSQRDAQKALNKEYQGGSAAVQAANEYQAALDKLSPSAQKVVLALIAMQDTWQAMTKSVQEEFFKNIAGDMGRLPSIIDTIGSILRPAADAMGRFAHNFLLMFDSPVWKRDMATIGQNNADIIDNLAGAFLSLLTFFKDLMIAAAPFTDWLTGAFQKGMENLSALLDTDPEKQGLAAWLEKVRGRLEKWWGIISNVASTLFNYGSAASEFGDWISDNLLEMTEGWKKNSEDAAKDGSKFKQYLENIQPLLSTVNDLIGQFFGWFAEESMDPENITDAQELVEEIGKMGEAIGKFLDSLAKTDIDDKIVKAITAIIDSLTAILDAGGTAGFETFMDVIVGFFDALAKLLGGMDEGSVSLLMSVLGGLAGAAFIGKFSGLTSAIGWLLRLDKATFKNALALLGKIGLVGAVGTGLVANGISTGNILSDVNRANESTAAGDPMGSRTALTENGSLVKGLAGGLGIGIGPLTEFIRFFSPETAATMDTWLADASRNIFDWIGKVSLGMSLMWPNIKLAWEKFWGQDIPNVFNVFIQTWTATWDGFWGGIRTNWDNFWNGVATNFQNIVNNIGAIWTGIQQKFKDPINWVIRYVYNEGIRGIWNAIARPFGWTQLGEAAYIQAAPIKPSGGGGGGPTSKAFARGGVLPGYSPGVDNHHFTDQNGNQLDLGGGEGILIPQATRMLGGEKGIEQINRDARHQKFAKGGVFGDAPASTFGGKKKGTGGVWEVAGDLWDKFTSFFKNPFGYITGKLGEGVNGLLSNFSGGSEYNKLLSRIPGQMIENLGNFGKDKAKDAKRKQDDVGGSMGTDGMGWKSQWAAVKAAFPSANLNSAYRPGAITSTGSKSYHGQGRAIDVTASSAIFNWIKSNYGAKSKELIYSPMGGQQIQNGRNYNWGEPVRSQHFDHVHWAMRQGGVIPKLYDQGGWLPHGGMAVNKSGKPEAVLTATESQALKGLLRGQGLTPGAQGLSAGTSVGSLRGAAQQVNDYSVNVGSVTINNPVPEVVSVSLPKAIRQVGYMQNARSNG